MCSRLKKRVKSEEVERLVMVDTCSVVLWGKQRPLLSDRRNVHGITGYQINRTVNREGTITAQPSQDGTQTWTQKKQNGFLQHRCTG